MKENRTNSLVAQKLKLLEKLARLEKEKKVIDRQLKTINERLAGIESALKRISDRDIYITSHFIERYRERIGPADITAEEIKEKILTPMVIRTIDTLHNCTYPFGEITLGIQDRKLITVYKKNEF